MLKKLIIYTFYIVIFISVSFFTKCKDSNDHNDKVFPLTESWEKIVPHQEVPEGLISLKAKDCGVCHQDHYEEWKYSTHSHAWTDLQFQAEIKKESSPFFCINCHILLENQQEEIVTGKINDDIYRPVSVKNPRFDKELQSEGITCATCHVRNNAIIGVHGGDNAPHKIIKDPDFLSEKLCVGCHEISETITPSLVCSFETGGEWEAGPFFEEQNCISCHMEETERSIVAGFPKKESHFHFFPGSGIPKHDSLKSKGLNGLSIEVDTIYKSYNTTSIDFNINLENKYAGHSIPTGDPERFFLITIEVKNQNDEIVSRFEEKIGETWEWHPVAKKLSDNNLKPCEKRNFHLNYSANTKGIHTVNFEVTKHRLSKESAQYNELPDSYPLFISIFQKTKSFIVE